MTREKKLEAIYKEMADTDIDEWCIIEAYGERWTILDYNWTRAYVWRQRWDFEKFDDYQHLSIKFWYKVIWRPVMIGSIFERYSSSRWFINSQFVMELIDKWTGYDNPIDDQTDECIDYVYSLIKKS